MSAEFDGLKAVIGEAVTAINALAVKIGTPPVQDPPAADIVAATAQLKTAVEAANAVLNPPAQG